ncbi:MAG: FixG Ig-like domain-containing protein, partial [Chloroflexota bacterium]
LALQPQTATTGLLTLDGSATYFAASTVPASSQVDPGQSIQYTVAIDSNIDETYTVTVDAPPQWIADIQSSGSISMTPEIDVVVGDYTFLISAQSHTHPDLFVHTTHTVTINDVNRVDVTLDLDSLTTVPMGPVLDPNEFIAVTGHIDNGQVEVTNAAYRIFVDNLSASAQTYQIDVSGLPAGWTLLSGAAGATSKTFTMDAGQSTELGLYVLPPDNTLPAAGASYNIQVDVTGISDPTLSDSATATFTMPGIPFAFLQMGDGLYYAVPDSTLAVDLEINNVGNFPAAFPVTTTVDAYLYFSEVYNGSSLTVSPNVFNSQSIPGGAAATETLTIDTTGAAIGESYLLQSHSVSGEYEPTTFAIIEILSPEALAALEAAALLGDLGDDIGKAYAEEVAKAIDQLARNLCDPDEKNDLIAALNSLVGVINSGPTQDALLDIIIRLSNATTQTECADLLTELGIVLDGLAQELEIQALYPYTLMLTPGAGGSLVNQVANYSASITNLGSSPTTYELTVSTPAGPTTSQIVVNPSSSEEIDIPVSSSVESYYNITAQTVVLDSGMPLPETSQTATAAFNVADRFVDVLGVYTDPAFIEVGAGPAQITAAIANVINSYQPLIAATEVISPDGSTLFSDTLPLNLFTGPPQFYDLALLDTSTLPSGIYTIEIDILDTNSQPVPGGNGYGFLNVGQSVQVEQEVFPNIVPPGDITVTTKITTEVAVPAALPSLSSLPMPPAAGSGKVLA